MESTPRIRIRVPAAVINHFASLRPGELEAPVVIRGVDDRRRSLRVWMERRGWEQVGDDRYRGWFRTPIGQWPGEVWKGDGVFMVAIKEPPDFMLSGPDSACLTPMRDGWYQLHQKTRSGWVIGTIRAVEVLICRQKALVETGSQYGDGIARF